MVTTPRDLHKGETGLPSVEKPMRRCSVEIGFHGRAGAMERGSLGLDLIQDFVLRLPRLPSYRQFKYMVNTEL
jgi:hypothetical protein